MSIKNWKEGSINLSSSEINPITNQKVFHQIDKKYYRPKGLIANLKHIVKSIIKHPSFMPPLHYDQDIDFAFFPRLKSDFIERIYDSGNSLDISLELRNASSRTKKLSAKFILEWIENQVQKHNHKIEGREALVNNAGLSFISCETTTLDWETEYVRRFFGKDEVNLKAYRLFDLWTEEGNGERLLCLAQKNNAY
tara:strand:+ start:547 stop:1131 length:585 start_codon:yes stop_codon:yes gene_type:complete